MAGGTSSASLSRGRWYRAGHTFSEKPRIMLREIAIGKVENPDKDCEKSLLSSCPDKVDCRLNEELNYVGKLNGLCSFLG